MDQQIDTELRKLHSRITDNDALAELHSADIATFSEVVQNLAKRLHVVEELLAFHCGCEVKDLRQAVKDIRDGKIDEDNHEIGVCSVVPGD